MKRGHNLMLGAALPVLDALCEKIGVSRSSGITGLISWATMRREQERPIPIARRERAGTVRINVTLGDQEVARLQALEAHYGLGQSEIVEALVFEGRKAWESR